jgi:hypothetical protein
MNCDADKKTPHRRARRRKAYVALPGHPFFGARVRVLQEGRTDTTRWCLIAHPARAEYHYRLPARWLSDDPPCRKLGPSQSRGNVALAMAAMEQLVRLLQGFGVDGATPRGEGGDDGEAAAAPNRRSDLATSSDREEGGADQQAVLRAHRRRHGRSKS